MGAFTPFKRHAKEFNYTPRYYDPQKEAREQRRAEMSGKRSDEGEGYKPGQYIRTQSAARSVRRSSTQTDGRAKMWIMLGIVVAALFLGTMLYNKIVEVFIGGDTQRPTTEVYEEFNPYAPIEVVPNDYDPSQD